MNWLRSKLYWLDSLITWWQTRHLDDEGYRQHLLQEVIDARNQLLDEYKDEPATKELIEAFSELDIFIETCRAQCY